MRRPYSDVVAEMATRLSVLPDYQTQCRLIHKTGKKDQFHSKIECHIFIENIEGRITGEQKEKGKKIAAKIHRHSREMAPSIEEVEADIAKRSLGETEPEELQTAEEL